MSDPIIPTTEQLAENRREHWHQTGAGLLTMESLLPFVQSSGLLLYNTRGPQFPCPAPTLVEAVLGAPTPASSIADREPARSLLQRMVAEGTALPLNLLGAPGTTPDEPDFLCSLAVFPYLFTLRGDKGWKQLPTSSGPFKVSPLAVNTYTLLSESGPRSASDLANELGKGLTEAAVLRALSELWQHLRVLPVGQTDGTTLWELTSARFTKAIKAGANAGQPSALSALITLYLGQAVLASEDDVEVFLSTVAPRSRVREILHALTAARELGSVVVEGRHLLHVSGDLPEFQTAAAESGTEATNEGTLPLAGEGRIKKFGTGPRKPPFGKAKPFAAGGDRERRPFDRGNGPSRGPVRRPAAFRADPAKPTFNRPWEEERAARTARAEAPADGDPQPEFQDIDLDAAERAPAADRRPSRPTRPSSDRPKKPFGKPSFGDRKSFADRNTGGGGRPSSGDRPRPSFGDRPRPAPGDRKSFGDRPRPAFGDRKPFGDRPKPAFGDRKPFGDRPKPAFGGRPSFGDRPRTGGGDRPAFSRNREGSSGASDRPAFRGPRPTAEGGGAPFKRPSRPGFDRTSGAGGRPPFRPAGDRPFRPRPDAEGDSRPPRRDFTGKPFNSFDRPSRPRPEAAEGARRPPFKRFDARPDRPSRPGGGGRPDGTGRARPDGPGRPEGGRPPYKRFDAPRPARSGGSPDRPAPGGKRPFTPRPGRTLAPGEGPFDKFKATRKPWGNRPPKRLIKPEED